MEFVVNGARPSGALQRSRHLRRGAPPSLTRSALATFGKSENNLACQRTSAVARCEPWCLLERVVSSVANEASGISSPSAPTVGQNSQNGGFAFGKLHPDGLPRFGKVHFQVLLWSGTYSIFSWHMKQHGSLNSQRRFSTFWKV